MPRGVVGACSSEVPGSELPGVDGVGLGGPPDEARRVDGGEVCLGPPAGGNEARLSTPVGVAGAGVCCPPLEDVPSEIGEDVASPDIGEEDDPSEIGSRAGLDATGVAPRPEIGVSPPDEDGDTGDVRVGPPAVVGI